MLGLSEGSRVDVALNPVDNCHYIAALADKSGRNVSKTGKVQSEKIHSWLVDNPKGEAGVFEVTDTVVEDNGIKWHKIVIFEGSNDAPQEDNDEAEVAVPASAPVSESADSTPVDNAANEEQADEAEGSNDAVRAEVGAEEVEDTENF